MWVVNREKEQARTSLRNDVNGLINRMGQQVSSAQQLLSEITYTTSGCPSGMGDTIADACIRAQEQLSQALTELQASKSCLDSVEIREWVEDDDDF